MTSITNKNDNVNHCLLQLTNGQVRSRIITSAKSHHRLVFILSFRQEMKRQHTNHLYTKPQNLFSSLIFYSPNGHSDAQLTMSKHLQPVLLSQTWLSRPRTWCPGHGVQGQGHSLWVNEVYRPCQCQCNVSAISHSLIHFMHKWVVK